MAITGERGDRLSSIGSGWVVAFGAYVGIFALLGAPWLAAAARAVPSSAGLYFAWADDARLVAWILGWVWQALASAPARLFEAPIHYPAPAQLAATEHFLSSQVVAAPVLWATGNPVLAANLVAWASYPLGAFAMERLVRALGCARDVAWVAGLAFALGPLRVPANVQVVQYVNLFLPLAALALLRLRARPRAGTALGLWIVLVAGLLSSYYLAAMLAVVAGLAAAGELLRAGPGRGQFALAALAAAALALGPFVLFSRPYLARAEVLGAGVLNVRLWSDPQVAWGVVTHLVPKWLGLVPLMLAALGLLAVLSRGTARRVALAGLAFVLVGLLLVAPPRPLAAALAASPAGFFRVPWRFVVIVGFGTALLTAAGLEAMRRRTARAGVILAALAAALLLLGRGRTLSERGLDPVRPVAGDAAVYAAVAASAGADPGPLLELPLVDARARTRGNIVPRGSLEPDAMIGARRHRLPLLTGHTGYRPAHRVLLETTLQRLPARDALDDLADMTHLRWLLLRPADYWADAGVRAGLLALPEVKTVLQRDGWVLARLERRFVRTAWFEALARGTVPGRTVLGTTLEPLGTGAVAEVAAVDPPAAGSAGDPLGLTLRVRNLGPRAWPAAPAVPGALSRRFTVALVARWRGAGELPAPQGFLLPRDVLPGEAVRVPVSLVTPGRPGPYELEVAPVQEGGALFDAPGNAPLRLQVMLTRG